MKKVVLVLLMAAMAAGGLFAEGLSWGVGLVGDSQTLNMEISPSSIYSNRVNETAAFSHIGANFFLDAKFVEIKVDLLLGDEYLYYGTPNGSIWYRYPVSTTDIVLGLVGKFPIAIGEKFELFPYAGIDYNLNISSTYNGNEYSGTIPRADLMNRLAIVFGVGGDFKLNDTMFIRAEIGYGIILPNKGDKDYIDWWGGFKYNNTAYELKIERAKIPYKVCIGWKL
jgi:hypothetical protein